jgi:O-antigen/teichoic acid export membrane protein
MGIYGIGLYCRAPRPAVPRATSTHMGTPSTPIPTPPEPGGEGATAGLAKASGWNLLLNLIGKSQTFALLAAGSIMGGIVGVGVIVTAVAACILGAAVGQFGLTGELQRLNVAFPNRHTVARSVRAVARQAPLGMLVSPLVYILVGPTTGSLALLAMIGLNSWAAASSTCFTAILQGVGDFRSPAIRLGGARFAASVGAIVAAVVEPQPAVVIGCFTAGEAIGAVALAFSIRAADKRLPDEDHPDAHLQPARHWFGTAGLIYLVTNQADTLLISTILSPTALGIFATASTLENGAATLASSTATPTAFRSIATTLSGDIPGGAHLLKRAFAVAFGIAVVLAVLGFAAALAAAGFLDKFEALAHGDGPVVLGLCLLAGPPAAVVATCLLVGAGFARHRLVGTRQIWIGVCAVPAIVVGAIVAGAVGAAAGTIVRDLAGLGLTRGLTEPPSEAEASAVEGAAAGTIAPPK